MTTTLRDMMGSEPESIANAVSASAQQIWQAGLGAFAKAQQDGGHLFDTLVRDGAHLHQLTQELARDRIPGFAGKVGKMADDVGRQASGSWDKIEKIFEDRVARALRALGVPSRDEVEALRREIDGLKAAMARAGGEQGAAPSAAATKAAKAPAKRTPAKAVKPSPAGAVKRAPAKAAPAAPRARGTGSTRARA